MTNRVGSYLDKLFPPKEETEIVEEVERSKLNDREDYWQEYFHAKDFGYSIK